MRIQPILQIAIPTPLRRTFDYTVPADSVHQWQIGQRVQVLFGQRPLVGVVTDIVNSSLFPENKLKPIQAAIDAIPLLDEKLLSLYHWASDYYQHPIGDVIVGTLPKKIREGQVASSAASSIIATASIEKSQPDFKLTQEQTQAIEAITQTTHFQPFLLFGVTGSGKTEVYLRVIAEVLKQNKQALVLVPEIALTPQTVARFEARFSVPVLLLHSGLTDVRRFKSWMQSTQNTPCIVIGTRSAVFAPLKQCGIIIIDEEHDTSFKQQNGFRYCARDVAVMRAKLLNIPIVLGTATPSLESWKNATQHRYQLLTLSERAGNALLPDVKLHNIRGEKLVQGLSAALIAVMRKHLDQGNQVMLFLNRRGYAPVLMCHHCGWSVACRHCDARMTAHDNPKRLLCHHCGFQSSWIRICEGCKQSELTTIGLGTEQLEKTLMGLFPDKKITRMDRDNVKSFSALEKILTAVHARETDILIGTQMLVKGHHFEHVTLVAAVDVDNALFSADFRAIERLGQALVQVSGRAGRAEKSGEVFIQTHHPDHPLLHLLFEKNYIAFADAILEERSAAQLPPFTAWVLLRAESKNKNKAQLFLEAAKKQFISEQGVLVFGPLPPLMEKRAGVFRSQIILQSSSRNALKNVLTQWLATIAKQKKTFGLKWVLDVDPIEM